MALGRLCFGPESRPGVIAEARSDVGTEGRLDVGTPGRPYVGVEGRHDVGTGGDGWHGTRAQLVVLRALGLGDLLTAVPALRALARAFPAHERVLAAPAWLSSLVALIDADGQPAVHRVVDVAEMAALPAHLEPVDVAVNLHGRGPQSHRVVLGARPRRRIWFEHPAVAQSAGAPRWRADEHEVARWCRLLRESDIWADPHELRLPGAARASSPEVHSARALSAWARTATLIHPGAASPARRWPAERFGAVARAELERGRCVIITGSTAERPLAEAVARLAGLGEEAVMAGRTDLAALAAGVAQAARVVCGDTGMGHLATACGTPSVVLFGPTAPSAWGPPAGSDRHLVLWAGHTGDPHGRVPDPGLLEITVEQVVEALERLPASASPPAPEAPPAPESPPGSAAPPGSEAPPGSGALPAGGRLRASVRAGPG